MPPWISPKLGMQYGTCQGEYVTRSLYCVNTNSSGVGSGTGGFSAREEACIGKQPDDYCEYIGDSGHLYAGRRHINHNFLTPHPLYCSRSIRSGKDKTEDNIEIQ